MFKHAIAINEFLVAQFSKTIPDIPGDSLFTPGPGHGHPPAWVLGHLAITGEMGHTMFGGNITHPDWLAPFGPESSDRVVADPSLTKETMSGALTDAYRKLRERAKTADATAMDQPHSVKILSGSPIKTVGDCVALLLTNHFAFHLSQLSCCRRAAGFKYLF